ncbi:MAG: hypothetical protein HY000_28935 [Planctomycetes bacterium]|nr:hypothetical protein [Planctomycetota bacterium]
MTNKPAPTAPLPSTADEQVFAVLDAYWLARVRGESPNVDEWLDKYPAIRDQLAGGLPLLDEMFDASRMLAVGN